MTEEEFAAKVQWEGGVLEALDYGLRPGDVEPGELRRLWMALHEHHLAMTPLVEVTEDLIESLTND